LETKQPRSQAHIRREIRKYFKVDENKTYWNLVGALNKYIRKKEWPEL
jgi:hypothetical protein